MHRQYHSWFSPALHREMQLLEFGHAGANIIAFPTSQGTFYEWEGQGMLDFLRPGIERGWYKVITIDSVDRESWYDYRLHPGARAWRQHQYDQYIHHEILPWIYHRNQNHYIILIGASFGAYHALSFGFRHPQQVHRVISLSGMCDIRMFTDGYSDDTVRSVNPIEIIHHLSSRDQFRQLQQQDIILAVGRGDRLIHQNREMSGALWQRNIGNALREWDGFAHDWPIWRHMISLYLNGHD